MSFDAHVVRLWGYDLSVRTLPPWILVGFCTQFNMNVS